MKIELKTITGVVERAEIKYAAPFKPSYYMKGRQDVFLDVALRDDATGNLVYFKSPRGSYTVASCSMAAIPVYVIRNGAAQWLKEEPGAQPVATAGKPSTARLVSLVKAGDKITVEGVVKVERVSRKGIPYTALNRVKLVESKIMERP